MAKTPKRVTIGDSVYEFFPLAPDVSIKLLTRLIKLLGEALVRALAGVIATSGGEDADRSDVGAIKRLLKSDGGSETLARAVTSLATKLDEDEVLRTIKQLVENAMVQRPGDNGTRRIVFDVDFQGRIGELLVVTKSAIEAEYSNFFDVFESTTVA